MRSTLMMIDMNGPDIEAVDEVKALILESVNVWKNYKKRGPSRGSQGARAHRSVHARRNVYFQLSGLEDVVFNDFLQDDFIPEGDGQVASGNSGSAPLPDPVDLETSVISMSLGGGPSLVLQLAHQTHPALCTMSRKILFKTAKVDLASDGFAVMHQFWPSGTTSPLKNRSPYPWAPTSSWKLVQSHAC